MFGELHLWQPIFFFGNSRKKWNWVLEPYFPSEGRGRLGFFLAVPSGPLFFLLFFFRGGRGIVGGWFHLTHSKLRTVARRSENDSPVFFFSKQKHGTEAAGHFTGRKARRRNT